MVVSELRSTRWGLPGKRSTPLPYFPCHSGGRGRALDPVAHFSEKIFGTTKTWCSRKYHTVKKNQTAAWFKIPCAHGRFFLFRTRPPDLGDSAGIRVWSIPNCNLRMVAPIPASNRYPNFFYKNIVHMKIPTASI